MRYYDYWRDISLLRKVAMALCLAWLFFFSLQVAPAALSISPAFWSPGKVLLVLGCSAFCAAVVIVEVIRGVFPALNELSDATHFRSVALLYFVLFLVQSAGVHVFLDAYGSSAF